MDKESFIISQFKNRSIGDDGAVVGKWIYSKDLFFEDSHFKKKWLTPFQIAQKAMLVNISDAVAMNAKPKYALLGAAIPKGFSDEEIKELISGFKKSAKDYGVKIIGGDTISSDKLSLSVTIIAKKRRYTLRRSGLKKGDFLAFTGKLGDSKIELEKLIKGKGIPKNSRFVKPTLRVKFIKKATKYLRCGLDISDGLSKDLSRLCTISSLGVKFLRELSEYELCSGEEYEMLIAFSPKNKERILHIAKKTRTPINIFAEAISGHYVSQCSEHHF